MGTAFLNQVFDLLSARSGHFLLESGHHGDLWLDLEMLCLRPTALQPLASELARRLSGIGVEIICGPLVEGAFVALLAAAELNVEFTYAERFTRPSPYGLFPAGYRIPASVRARFRGKRVAIVNDVINAGSAVKGAFADLQNCAAQVVAIGSLLVLGTAAAEFAAEKNVALIALATRDNHLWTPAECPLCADWVPLDDPGEFKTIVSSD